MKNSITLLALLLLTMAKGQIKVSDLKTPDSPGFQLLDISPSTITKPQNPKEFAISMLNVSENGSALPKNFAMEFNPLWLFKKYDGIYKYYNVRHNEKNNYFSGVLRKLTLSLASTVLDSVKTGIKGETNYMAFSVRTNLLTIRSEKQHWKFEKDLNSYNQAVIELLNKRVNTDSLDGLLQVKLVAHKKLERQYKEEASDEKRLEIKKEMDKAKKEIATVEQEIQLIRINKFEDFGKEMDTLSEVKAFYKTLEEAPLFQLDAAFAYSEAYPDNSYGSRQFNRSGAWLTGTLNFKGIDQFSNRDRFSVLFTSRYLQDNVLEDATLLTFNREKVLDWGMKLEYAFEKLIIGVEHLQRSYTDAVIGNSKRTVGNLQYEIAKDLYFTGSYGQNFGEGKPLFALFGINFGIGKASFKTEESE